MNNRDYIRWLWAVSGRELLLASAFLVGACGGGGSGGLFEGGSGGGSGTGSGGSGSGGGSGGGSGDGGSSFVQRPLSDDFATRKAVVYSGFRGPTRDTIPSDSDILQDLQLLHGNGFGLLRTFDAFSLSQRVLGVIRDNPSLDMKVQLGIWIQGPDSTHHADNYTWMDEGIAVANNPDFQNIVEAVSVGNETMIDWSGLKVPVADMAAYLKYVRDQITQPVTTDDNWAFFSGQNAAHTMTFNTTQILAQIDFVSMHTYALLDSPYGLWDWKQLSTPEGPDRATAMMDASITWTESNFTSVKNYLQSHRYSSLPITIGEAGWKSVATRGETHLAHPVNQRMYVDRLNTWNALPKTESVPLNIFYFEAFDEPWKGADDGWGLFDVARKERYVIWGADVSQQEPLPAPPNDVAVYYVEPVSAGPITRDKYVVYSESFNGATDAQPSAGIQWNAWDGNTASTTELTSEFSEGTKSMQVTPVPSPNNWGWGLALNLVNPDDLTNFHSASGNLNFSIKTTYAGKLEMGFFTGNAADKTACDIYIPVSSGQYGYTNDGAWHQVSIPINTIVANAKPAYNMPPTACGTSNLHMDQVFAGLVIADRYAVTRNAPGVTTKIYVDDMYWSK